MKYRNDSHSWNAELRCANLSVQCSDLGACHVGHCVDARLFTLDMLLRASPVDGTFFIATNCRIFSIGGALKQKVFVSCYCCAMFPTA